MGNIFKESKFRQEVEAGEKEEGPGTRVKRPQPTGSASQDLVTRGGPSSEIANRETPEEKETRERREAEARAMKERAAAARAKK